MMLGDMILLIGVFHALLKPSQSEDSKAEIEFWNNRKMSPIRQ